MIPTTLETAILDWISTRHPSLAAALATIDVDRRDHTGAGIFVHLSADAGDGWDRPPVEGPCIESPDLEHGGGSLLWLLRGVPACLELYAFGVTFPTSLADFELVGFDGSAAG